MGNSTTCGRFESTICPPPSLDYNHAKAGPGTHRTSTQLQIIYAEARDRGVIGLPGYVRTIANSRKWMN